MTDPKDIAGLIEKLRQRARVRSGAYLMKEETYEWKAAIALESLAKENERLQQRIDLECDSYARDTIRAKTIAECSHLARVISGDVDITGESAASVATAYAIADAIDALAKPPAEPVATIDSVPSCGQENDPSNR